MTYLYKKGRNIKIKHFKVISGFHCAFLKSITFILAD